MLLLTRRPNESIVIGNGDSKITVTVLGIKGNQVRIGVDAPRQVSVHRNEIYDRIQRGERQTEVRAVDVVSAA